MKDIIDSIEKVFIHQDSWNSEVAERFKTLFTSDKIEQVSDMPYKNISGELSADEFTRSKKMIYITEFKGSFFKRCPGARPGLTCCNYFVLNLGLQCNMNCSYCYLQSFINTPIMTIYSNIDDALDELKVIADENPNTPFRVGTGEVIDSLSLDELTLYSKKLVKFFKNYPNWKLEFKTKSDKVDQFLDEAPANNVIASWSINPQYIIEQEEHGTANLEQRLSAARKCLDKGFQVAFHIDPVIWHPEWKTNYGNLVDQLIEKFEPKEIFCFSLGALRFQPEQRHIMKERFAIDSLVNSAEMFPSGDGKLRYDQELRKEMFDFVYKRFKDNDRKWNIFLCMETPETWLKTVDSMPKSIDGLEELFDHKVIQSYKTTNNKASSTSCKN